MELFIQLMRQAQRCQQIGKHSTARSSFCFYLNFNDVSTYSIFFSVCLSLALPYRWYGSEKIVDRWLYEALEEAGIDAKQSNDNLFMTMLESFLRV